ncbi:MAG: serine/threonine-protein kinase [Polyangiaceae bacterium]
MVDSTPPPADLPELIGRYRVVRLLGEGAMGRVLLAHDPVLDREVAVKHLRADLQIPDEVRRGLVKRMRHEARAAARVMHPHLVTLHDMGEDDRVGLYLVFEYVEGPTLKERVARGRMTPKEAARVAVELGTALTTAHEAGILHRDIKPENVILSKKGAKIADFGIAKIPDSTLTHQGGLMGTPAYSAPETFRTSTFSPESDQFSLAATLYEAASGKRAFPGDDAVAVAQRILHESAEPFAAALTLPEEVDRVFGRALSRRPRERFASCEAFGRALSDALLAVPTGGAGSAAGGDPAARAGSADSGAALRSTTDSDAALRSTTDSGAALRSTTGDSGSAVRSATGDSAARSASGDSGSAVRSAAGDSASRSASGVMARAVSSSAGDSITSRTGREERLASAPVTAADGLPRERRSSHIVLGVIAVALTGMLLVRTALKTTEETPEPTPIPTASAVAPAASSSAPKPPKIQPVRTSKPTSTSSPSGADAGAPGSEPGGADAPTSSSSEGPSPTSSASSTASAAPTITPDPLNMPLRPR